MSDEVLEKMTFEFLALNFSNSSFAWQGGEPTLMGLDFYKRVAELQKKYASPGQAVSNALQTNAVLLDDDWCKFLNEYNWLVGISLDGPKKYHDHYRLDHAANGTYDRVIKAIDCCKKNKVEFNVLVLLNDKNVQAPDELFDYFVGLDIKFLQFIPCIEAPEGPGKIADFSITPKQYSDFIRRIFDRWLEFGPEKISIRLFDSIMNYSLSGCHTNCTFDKRCNQYIVIEHNGQAYPCDFFVELRYSLGNIMDTNIKDLFNSPVKKDFAKTKKDLSNKCLICRHNNYCRGGCLKDRIVLNNKLNDPSYFCQAYKDIFTYIMPKLTELAANFVNKAP